MTVSAAPSAPAGAMTWMARGEEELPPTDRWLTRGEVARAAGLRYSKRRSEFLLRRWVCKQAVAASLGLSCDHASLGRIAVTNLPTGAPAVEVDGVPRDIAVSLTDRAGWAVCLVGGRGRVGCDLELVEPRTPGFAADFLTRDEQAFSAAVAEADRDQVLNLIWSAKESALKVLQTGLRRDTRSVEVLLESHRAPVLDPSPAAPWHPLEVRAVEGRSFPGWWRRDGTFLTTVVSEHQASPPTPLAGSADLGSAQPVHSWMRRPLV